MPGMYAADDFDLAGFSVGAMERGHALPSGVQDGDILLGLASDGVHSNGYSLVRKIVELSGLSWDSECPFGSGTLGHALLAPTRLYVKPALAAIKCGGVHGFAHITGGGLTENVEVKPGHESIVTFDLTSQRLRISPKPMGAKKP